MQEIIIQSNKAMTGSGTQNWDRLLDSSKPYIAVFLIVAALLTVWAGLCAA